MCYFLRERTFSRVGLKFSARRRYAISALLFVALDGQIVGRWVLWWMLLGLSVTKSIRINHNPSLALGDLVGHDRTGVHGLILL